MSDITVLHTGDAHIDQITHGRLNPETGINTAIESRAAALASAVTSAVENQDDLFLHCGDAFKDGIPSQEAVLLFADTLAPLVDAGIPVGLLGGNHDLHRVPSAQRTANATLAALLQRRGAEVYIAERDYELVTTKSGIQIALMPWLSKSAIISRLGLERLDPVESDKAVADYGLRALNEMYDKADHTSPLIVASHVTVDKVRIDSVAKGHKRGSEVDIAHIFAEPILPLSALEQGPAAYNALAHIHTRQRMGTKTFYAGSPDRITFTDAEDDKGANRVTISDTNELLSVDMVPTQARTMTSIALAEADAEKRLAALEKDTLVRLVLPPGESAVPESVREAISESGAILATTQVTPVDRPRTTVTSLPEEVNPTTALETWMGEVHPDADHKYLRDLAARLTEEVQV